MNTDLLDFLLESNIEYNLNVDLKKKTWIHRGGIAEVYILPKNALQLEDLVRFLYKKSIRFLLVGHTSNIYILNSTNIPVVVSTIKCRNYEINEDHIICEAGVGVINLSTKLINEGVEGFEYLTCLPGTIAAAVINNSSCKSNSISKLLISADVILKDGTKATFFPSDFGFSYRSSLLKRKEIEGTIISVVLKKNVGDSEYLRKEAIINATDRKQRLDGAAKNLGCTVNRIFSLGRMPLFYLYGAQIARIYEEQGNVEQAFRTYRLLLEEIRKYLESDFPYLLPEERSEIGLLLQYYLDAVQSFSLRHIGYKPVGELLFDHSLLKEGLLAIHPSPVAMAGKNRHPLVLTLQEAIDSLYRSPDYYLLPGDSCYFRKFRLQTDLIELKRKQVSVVKESGLNDSVSMQLKDWKSVQNYLEPHEAIIKIVDLPLDVFDRQYVALILTSDSSSPKVVLLPRKLELFRIGLKHQRGQRIWKPIRKYLKHSTEIYLCLEGEPMDFSWNNISYRKEKLLDSYDIHSLLSVKDFVRLKSDKTNGENVAVHTLYGFGGAYFSSHSISKGKRGQGVPYLAGSRKELYNIDAMLPETWKSHLFLGHEANKSNFLRLSAGVAPHSIVHIATHGFSLLYDESIPDGRIVSFKELPLIGSNAYPDPMMRNGFLLTGANRYWNKPVPYDAMDSGIVTAHDVSQMNLYGTDLVILSSCQSAAGEMMDGEGVYGLVRAFKVAGAQAVMANFNPISDEKTVLFITTFYRHWIGGDSMFDAFCRTQRELMESNPEDEFLWSGFVLFE